MPYQSEQHQKPHRYGGAVRTTGGSLLVFEVDEFGTTLKLNGCEIAHVTNPDMALLMTHIVEQIRRLIAQPINITAIDQEFFVVEEPDETENKPH